MILELQAKVEKLIGDLTHFKTDEYMILKEDYEEKSESYDE